MAHPIKLPALFQINCKIFRHFIQDTHGMFWKFISITLCYISFRSVKKLDSYEDKFHLKK